MQSHRCRFPFGHLSRQRLILLHRERYLAEGIAVGDVISGQNPLEGLLYTLTPLPWRYCSLQPPDQIFREPHYHLLYRHYQPATPLLSSGTPRQPLA
jgi:hypothetical protein